MDNFEYYYLVSFSCETDMSDPLDPVVQFNLEHFHYLGDAVCVFEEMMGIRESAPNPLGQMKLGKRLNPQRHIRIFGIKINANEEMFKVYCQYTPKEAFRKCIEGGVEL